MCISIVIAGPTGSGKTDIAVKLAKLINGQIISADSRQIYKYLDIGTNKAGKYSSRRKLRIEKGIPQYLTDILEPSQSFSAGDFAQSAGKLIKKIRSSNKAPIIVGGTGLYIKALIDGLAPLPEADPVIRQELNKQLREHGVEYINKKLAEVDPESAKRNRHNPQRLIRALEVYRLTGLPITELHKKTIPSKEKFVQFGLRWQREKLYRNLDKRCKRMLNSGIVEETKRVIQKGFSKDSPGLKSIGYNHIVEYLAGNVNYKEMEFIFMRDIRRYAKRQMTWFRKDARISWIDMDKDVYNPHLTAKNIMKKVINLGVDI